MFDVADRMVEIGGLSLHIREWLPEKLDSLKPVFVLLHGLSSNAHTWDMAAAKLAEAGYKAVAVDQRGHGLSDKPESGYDFVTVTDDLKRLLDTLELKNVVIAGQSWGGNVVLNFGVRFPQAAQALIFVDGGFLNLKDRGSWEQVSAELRPPNLNGIPRAQLAERIATGRPGWVPDGVEATLNNFETLPDGTLRPWLSLDRHMQILRAMYDQDASQLYARVQVPVLICPANDGSAFADHKRPLVEAAAQGIAKAQVVWFEDTAHDIHVDRPEMLVREIVTFIR